jgi:Tfp pilus assembly protein FimT
MNADEACSEEWRGNYLMVFVDSNKNQQRDNDEEIFYRQPWELSQIALSWNRPYSSIAFQPDGSAVLNGTLTLADQEGTVFKSLKISKVGRTRIE